MLDATREISTRDQKERSPMPRIRPDTFARGVIALLLLSTGAACGGKSIDVWGWSAAGVTWEPGQTVDPRAPALLPLAPSYTFTAFEDVDGDRQRFEWSNAPGVPFYLAYTYAAIVGQDGGLFDGVHDLFSQTGGKSTTAMRPDRVAAFRKIDRLGRPDRFLLKAQTDPSSFTALPDQTYDQRLHHVREFNDTP